jgi:hypothetical protein
LSLNKDLANWVYQYLDCISLSLYMASKLYEVMILLDGSTSLIFFREIILFKIDLLKQLKKLFFGMNRYNGLQIVITV